ncbi:MAG: ribulose-phosphate 3-epimerase [Planctomycetaceae bacterium]|nr:MAG: ribulose-phosphate 3-epimerase [Planctomycetaceae bacterium]
MANWKLSRFEQRLESFDDIRANRADGGHSGLPILKKNSDVVRKLRDAVPVVAPSLLKCDFSNLQREVDLLEQAGAKVLHLDVMDGNFVPNLSYGPMVIRSLRQITSLPFDAHLMISDPAKYLDEYLDAGCDLITFHVEAVAEPLPLLQRIGRAGVGAGLALNPGTPLERVLPWIAECDLVLVMSVEPGFGGQAFQPAALEKLRRLRQMCTAETLISIDGGIGRTTIEETARAGANMFVAGSAIFDTEDYRRSITELTIAAEGAAVSARTD